jgi:CheY-like chemotaxis protein
MENDMKDTSNQLRKPTILIVDDDRDLLDLVCQIIEFSDMSAKGISDGREVLNTLGSGHFDAVLMDIYIGSQDGREIVKLIKTDPQLFHTPVLLYSAGHIDENLIKACGADGFLTKPFDMTELIEQLNRVIVK